MTIGLAKEVAADGIRVNAVRSGVVYTDIHASGGEPNRVERVKEFVPMKRGGYPEEIAQAILWLLSDEASYCTGAIIDVADAQARFDRLLILAGARLLNGFDDRIGFETELQGLDQVTVTLRIDDRLYLRLEHVINRQAQLNATEWAGIGRIAPSHGFELHARRIDIGRAKQHDQIILAVFLRQLFDSTLNLKVHRTGGGSNETLGSRVDHLTTQILDCLFDGVGGHAVALA
jgi:hypothetical protein